MRVVLPLLIGVGLQYRQKSEDKSCDEESEPGNQPGYRTLEEHNKKCPASTKFPADGGNAGHTRRVEKAKYQHGYRIGHREDVDAT